MTRGHAFSYSSKDTPHSPSPSDAAPLEPWEAMVIDAVGNTIDFWRFKRNHGRVWGLLYLRGVPLSSQQLEDVLQLSKGAVNLVTRELEHWKVIKRVRLSHDAVWYFIPETDFWGMVRRVLEEREAAFVLRVRNDLESALSTAKKQRVSPDKLQRVERLLKLATLVDKALRGFLKSARLDVLSAIGLVFEVKSP